MQLSVSGLFCFSPEKYTHKQIRWRRLCYALGRTLLRAPRSRIPCADVTNTIISVFRRTAGANVQKRMKFILRRDHISHPAQPAGKLLLFKEWCRCLGAQILAHSCAPLAGSWTRLVELDLAQAIRGLCVCAAKGQNDVAWLKQTGRFK